MSQESGSQYDGWLKLKPDDVNAIEFLHVGQFYWQPGLMVNDVEISEPGIEYAVPRIIAADEKILFTRSNLPDSGSGFHGSVNHDGTINFIGWMVKKEKRRLIHGPQDKSDKSYAIAVNFSALSSDRDATHPKGLDSEEVRLRILGELINQELKKGLLEVALVKQQPRMKEALEGSLYALIFTVIVVVLDFKSKQIQLNPLELFILVSAGHHFQRVFSQIIITRTAPNPKEIIENFPPVVFITSLLILIGAVVAVETASPLIRGKE